MRDLPFNEAFNLKGWQRPGQSVCHSKAAEKLLEYSESEPAGLEIAAGRLSMANAVPH